MSCFLFPLLIVFSVCVAPLWSPCSPNMSICVLPGNLYHWQFASNLKECKENRNLMMHQIFHGYMWKRQIASVNSIFQVAAFLSSIYCEILVVVLSVLSSGIWPCVDSCVGGFTVVYYFHLQCSPVMDAFRKYGQLWSSALNWTEFISICVVTSCNNGLVQICTSRIQSN